MKKVCWRRGKNVLVGVCIGGVIVLMLCFSADTANGVRQGLSYACEMLVPSLFPFMVLSSFLIRSGLIESLGTWGGGITKRWFHLPPHTAGAILLSFFGGFPVGAKCVRLLYEQEKITAQQAEQMMLFCVGAGPAFLVTGIGTLLLHDPRAGGLLFTAQLVAGVLLGGLAGRLFPAKDQLPSNRRAVLVSRTAWTDVFLQSCSDGANALLQMTALVALFAMLSAMSERTGVCVVVKNLLQWCGAEETLAEHFYYILTEVTAACQRITQERDSLWLLAMAVGFGGCCVHCQVWAILGDLPLHKGRFLLFRVLQAFISSVIVYGVSRFHPLAVMAMADTNTGENVHIVWHSMTVTGTGALLLLSLLFVLSLQKRQRL